MADGGVITGVSVSHHRASVDEIAAACGDSDRAVVEDLLVHDGVDEALAIQTCNRAEAYVVTEDGAVGRRVLESFAPEVREGAVVHMDHEESLRHLMRVAAGLESLVLGEDQIMGQLREALAEARAVGGPGSMLEDAVTKAIHVGERARTETAINQGVVSLGSAAVRLAERELGERGTDLAGATVLVVGAGEMGTLTARALADAGVAEVVVANRTLPHAEHVACELSVPARAVPLETAAAEAVEADVVISATGAPAYVLDREDLADAGHTLVVDIAQPRDVDPAVENHEDLTLQDIDALEEVTEEGRRARRAEVEAVEDLIDEEFERLLAAYKRTRADDAISRMYESADRVKARELREALTKLEAQGGLTDDQRESVRAMADALVGQLLAAPTKSLREAAVEDDWTTIQTAMRLFNPEFDGDPAAPADGPRRPQGARSREARSQDARPQEAPDGTEAAPGVSEHVSDD